MKIKGGAYQISQGFEARIGRDHIRFNAPVRRIVQSDNGVVVSLTDGTQLEAEYVVVATPPHLGATISFEPALPIKRTRLMQHSLPGLQPWSLCMERRTFFF